LHPKYLFDTLYNKECIYKGAAEAIIIGDYRRVTFHEIINNNNLANFSVNDVIRLTNLISRKMLVEIDTINNNEEGFSTINKEIDLLKLTSKDFEQSKCEWTGKHIVWQDLYYVDMNMMEKFLEKNKEYVDAYLSNIDIWKTLRAVLWDNV
jgi:hypothetical protein